MLIDGAMMLTTRDNFLYHEMMSHPALFTHADPKQVVIIGGGDCGTLREVLRHAGVESAVQCDIDEQVTRRSEEHTSGLQSLMRISYAVFCLKKKTTRQREQERSDAQETHSEQTKNTH